MTVENSTNDWFAPVDMETYKQLVANSVPAKVAECPPDKTVGQPGVQVACGPNLRFLGCLENGSNNYRGSILLVLRDTDASEQVVPVVKYLLGPAFPGAAGESAPALESGEFPGVLFHQEQGCSFWRFSIELGLAEYEQKVKYSINDELNSNFQFFLPAVQQSMNVMSYSCNGFSLSVDTKDFNGSLWLDVLRKHSKLPYHVMIGGGDQIYCDSVKKSSKPFEKWLRHKKLHSNTKLTPEMVASFEEYYLTSYISWFGKGYWQGSVGKTLQSTYPLALQQIPQVNIFDDHDIIDGFGSYRDSTMSQEVFLGVGNSAFKYYMLFQHHTSVTENPKLEPSWILGHSKGPYITEHSRSLYCRLGREVAMLGLDCRTERTKKQIVSNSTYTQVFQRLTKEIVESNGEIKHLLVLLGVPICYPRMVWAESIMSSSVLAPVKYLARKGVIAKGLVNEFDGSIELLDDLNDHWCAVHHKHERNWLMGELVRFGSANGVRITILSGDVHLGCLTRLKTKLHKHHIAGGAEKHEENKKVLAAPQKDPRLIFNVVSSAIVNTPPPDGMATLLEKRAKIHHFDRHTVEDVVPLFMKDPLDQPRSNHLFLNKRNYADLIPMKNIVSTERYRRFQPGDLIHPGPSISLTAVSEHELEAADGDKAGYPYDQDSLVTTFHFEVDMKDPESETYDYEVLIPKLEGEFMLEGIGEK